MAACSWLSHAPLGWVPEFLSKTDGSEVTAVIKHAAISAAFLSSP